MRLARWFVSSNLQCSLSLIDPLLCLIYRSIIYQVDDNQLHYINNHSNHVNNHSSYLYNGNSSSIDSQDGSKNDSLPPPPPPLSSSTAATANTVSNGSSNANRLTINGYSNHHPNPQPRVMTISGLRAADLDQRNGNTATAASAAHDNRHHFSSGHRYANAWGRF